MASTGWYKSSRSDNASQCVEVNFTDSGVLVRDSKYTGDEATRPIIRVAAAQWASFLHAILTGGQAVPEMAQSSDGSITLSHNGIDLTYTPAEWDAFLAGVRNGEFTHEAVAA